MIQHKFSPAQHKHAILCATLLGLACSASAVEGGAPITPFGVSDFGAGMLPPPSGGATVGLRATSYHASQARDDAGNRSPTAVDLTVNTLSVAVIKMSNTTILGAKYGYIAVLPVLYMDLGLGIPTPAGPFKLSGKKTALGDICVMPVVLQWASGALFQSATLQVQAPTGSYEKNRLVNTGSNHWTYSPTYAVSYIGATGFEVSSTAQVNINTRNHATNYRSGNEWQHEFALGQHVGAYTIGLGGYRYQQFSDDGGGAAANRARVTALGPTLNFFAPGSGLPTVWIHAYKEFGARNRSQGAQIALRASLTF